MAIEAYVGLPGHGKSYGVVEHVIIPSIMEGRHVVTNIPLEREDLLADFGQVGSEITQLPEDWFERDDMSEFIPHGSVAVLDELWRRWPSGLKANAALLTDKALLAEHRHRVDDKGRSMRIVLVTQDLSQLASWVRILVEQTYKMTKLTAIGSSKKYRVDIYLGAPTGQNIPKSKLIRQTFGQYKKSVYKYYSSATQSATGTVGDESKADKRGNIWRSPFMIFAVVGPVIGIPLLLWWLFGYFTSGFGMVDDAKAANKAVPAVQQQPQALGLVNPPPPDLIAPAARQGLSQPASVNAGPVDSIVWRVAGYIRRGDAGVSGLGGWPSVSGYGHHQEQAESVDQMPDLVILHSSIHGIRYVVATECEPFPDGVNWHCTVDGTRATPWSGRGDSTHWAGDSRQLVGRTAAVASGATESSDTTDPVTNPPPRSL